MKQSLIIVSAVAALFFAACGNKNQETQTQDKQNKQAKAASAKIKNYQDSISWAMGTSIGIAVRDCGAQFNNEVVLAAVRHAMGNEQQPFDQATYEDLLIKANMEIANAKRQKETAVINEEQAYFNKLVKENPNVKKAEQGFYYEVLRPGKGPNAQYTQRLTMDYKGYLMLTGKMFDQTYGNRSSITTNVAEHMFPGLRFGLLLMNEGSIYRFYFPNRLAFGAHGTEDIPPYAPVIYEVELHKLYKD